MDNTYEYKDLDEEIAVVPNGCDLAGSQQMLKVILLARRNESGDRWPVGDAAKCIDDYVRSFLPSRMPPLIFVVGDAQAIKAKPFAEIGAIPVEESPGWAERLNGLIVRDFVPIERVSKPEASAEELAALREYGRRQEEAGVPEWIAAREREYEYNYNLHIQ